MSVSVSLSLSDFYPVSIGDNFSKTVLLFLVENRRCFGFVDKIQVRKENRRLYCRLMQTSVTKQSHLSTLALCILPKALVIKSFQHRPRYCVHFIGNNKNIFLKHKSTKQKTMTKKQTNEKAIYILTHWNIGIHFLLKDRST